VVGAPLSVALMHAFATPASTGVAPTFVVLGAVYLVYMLAGAAMVRVPAADWQPAGYVPRVGAARMVTHAQVAVDVAWKTPQFWLLWLVLCMNVTAGIALLSQASPMIQEMFPGRVNDVLAGAFVGLLSLFNMLGRFFWSSTSDKIGRRNTYAIFFLLGIALYLFIPTAGHMGSIELFVLGCVIVLSMYGGGFATIPAYLRDMFGTMHVGAIHGRLLTAWSTAGVLGPLLINQLREQQIASGVSKAQAYSVTMYVMAGLLLVGFICNFLMRPVGETHHYRGLEDQA
jgi:MFS family permease